MFFLAISLCDAFTARAMDAHVATVLDRIHAPRPWLENQAYMERVYAFAQSEEGATGVEMKRLHLVAHQETREHPRTCGKNGCGPFQQVVHALVPKPLRRFSVAHRTVRWLLTNHPGFAAHHALDLLRRCEALSGAYWHCCYGGAYRPSCRVKWDKTFQDSNT